MEECHSVLLEHRWCHNTNQHNQRWQNRITHSQRRRNNRRRSLHTINSSSANGSKRVIHRRRCLLGHCRASCDSCCRGDGRWCGGEHVEHVHIAVGRGQFDRAIVCDWCDDVALTVNAHRHFIAQWHHAAVKRNACFQFSFFPHEIFIRTNSNLTGLFILY